MTTKHFSATQLENMDNILKFATGNQDLNGQHAGAAWGITKAQCAYILATAEHESYLKPIEEIGGSKKPYAPYYGRGYVQLTHKENYEKYAKFTGLDLVSHPELALNPDVACLILVHGMAKGVFTGKKLSDYINANTTDFVGARRIINGQDRAQHIADMATWWLGALQGTNKIESP